MIETQFDLLSIKAAVNGARRAMVALDRYVPLQTQVTIELTGRMLPGTEIGAALTVLDAMQVDVVGLNCATGPVEMSEALRHLSGAGRVPISCIPNAGLPSVVDGQMHYDLTAEDLAEHLHRFVTEFGVTAIGGCCGTTPAHLAAVVDRCADATPARREPVHEAAAASIYTSVPFQQDTSFLVVGERTNANGSKAFREAMLEGDWDTCVAMARDQVKEGSHLIDVCVDYTGADGVADMTEVASRFLYPVERPDHGRLHRGPGRARRVLEWIGGRPILNSVNLEEGDEPGTRLDTFLRLAREFGAAVVCTCIDEEGQARTARVEAAVEHASIRDIAVERYGLEPQDLLFDAPALPLSTGHGGEPGRRHRDHRGDPCHQGRAPGRVHHLGPLQRVVRAEPGGPPGVELGLPARVRGGRPRLRHRACVEDPAPCPHRRTGQGDMPGPRLRPPSLTTTTPSRSCWRSSRA